MRCAGHGSRSSGQHALDPLLVGLDQILGHPFLAEDQLGSLDDDVVGLEQPPLQVVAVAAQALPTVGATGQDLQSLCCRDLGAVAQARLPFSQLIFLAEADLRRDVGSVTPRASLPLQQRSFFTRRPPPAPSPSPTGPATSSACGRGRERASWCWCQRSRISMPTSRPAPNALCPLAPPNHARTPRHARSSGCHLS